MRESSALHNLRRDEEEEALKGKSVFNLVELRDFLFVLNPG
jgi:hypothetical protein